MTDSILEVRDFKKYFPVNQRKNVFVKAVDGISFSIRRGETFGLVGESGSGKSTTAYTAIGLYGATSGKILFEGNDISGAAKTRSLAIKKNLQMVFQDPGTTLNPHRSVAQSLEVLLQIHKMLDHKNKERQLVSLLDAVELPPDFLYKYPRALGGGERQMLAIARAIATKPSFLILDEPTSSLDVSVQAKIINLLMRLQQKNSLSYLFITHDLSLMRNLATRVAIMYLGKIEEMAPAADFFSNPKHPYTQMLLSAIPTVTKKEEELKPKRIVSRGEIPSPVNVPSGCGFRTRCPLAGEHCSKVDPVMVEIEPEHFVRCHLLTNAS